MVSAKWVSTLLGLAAPRGRTLAAAYLVADDFASRGHDEVVVQADSWVSFNGRQRQRMIDPRVDLASLGRRSRTSTCLLALDPSTLD